MAEGRRYTWTGLLTMALIKRITNNLFFTLLMLLTTMALFAAGDETGPRILVRSLPDRPVAGSRWTLTLLIDHGEPNEVDILAPHFDGALFLEQVIKTPRFMGPGATAAAQATSAVTPTENLERWTVMEYRFVLNSPGTVSFDAFTIITPQGQSKTTPFNLNIQRPQNAVEVQNYRFAWEGIPSGLTIGESAVLTLRSSEKNLAGSLPDAGQFLPLVPPGHILESLSLTPAEKSAGIALKLRLIPLEPEPLVLARRQFLHGGALFEVPALRIPVRRTAAEKNIRAQEAAGGSHALPFPPLDVAIEGYPKLYQKYRDECNAVYTVAGDLWEEGRRASALAMLRQNERDHPAGALFAIIRRRAEQDLGLNGAKDEKRSLFKGSSRSAVLRETPVRRIPDTAGEEIARFREGQPVLLNGKTRHKTWVQVIANDHNGTSGWVPEEMIIFY